jgi:hypothetical protein
MGLSDAAAETDRTQTALQMGVRKQSSHSNLLHLRQLQYSLATGPLLAARRAALARRARGPAGRRRRGLQQPDLLGRRLRAESGSGSRVHSAGTAA